VIAEPVWLHLQTYAWPGNLRELDAFARSWALGLPLPGEEPQAAMDGRPLHQAVADFERTVIENALRAVDGNVLQLEQALGTPRKTLYDKLNRYGLQPRDFRPPGARPGR